MRRCWTSRPDHILVVIALLRHLTLCKMIDTQPGKINNFKLDYTRQLDWCAIIKFHVNNLGALIYNLSVNITYNIIGRTSDMRPVAWTVPYLMVPFTSQ